MKKYPNAENYFKNNPAETEALNQLMQTAGMNSTAQDLINKMFAEKAQPQPQTGGWLSPDFLKGITGQRDLMPSKPPASGLSPEKHTSLAEAHDRFVKENGRQPTPAELVKAVRSR